MPAHMRNGRRVALIVPAATLALAAGLLAGPADAAAGANVSVGVQTVNGQQHIVVEGTNSFAGENVYIELKRSSPGVGYWQISAMTPNFATLMTDLGPGCARDSNPYMNAVVNCPTTGITRIDVYLYDGPDKTVPNMDTWAELTTFRVPLYIDGGSGRDDLRGGPLDDEIHGGAGNDDIMGDIGRDRLYGGLGNDTFEGDTRNLLSLVDLFGDEFHGEDGIDELYEPRFFGVDEFWSLDNLPNDGADLDDDPTNGAEEGDNVFSDVENITTGSDIDHIIGSAAANVIRSGGSSDTIMTLGGADDINDFSGANYVNAGPGDDTVWVQGVILGGTGDDDIRASDGGNDTITPGPGLDNVQALAGNDTVNAADGQRDVLNCGAGTDVATTDASDVLGTSPTELCEFVMGPVAAPVLTNTLGTMRITAPGAGTMVVTVTTPVTTLGRTAVVTLGSKTITTTGAARLSVSVPWTTAGRARATGASMATTVKLRFTKRGTTSSWATTTRAVTFKR